MSPHSDSTCTVAKLRFFDVHCNVHCTCTARALCKTSASGSAGRFRAQGGASAPCRNGTNREQQTRTLTPSPRIQTREQAGAPKGWLLLMTYTRHLLLAVVRADLVRTSRVTRRNPQHEGPTRVT